MVNRMSVAASRHPKFRTKLCRNFANGSCPFGPKCSFLHPALRINPPCLVAQQLFNFNWNALVAPSLALSHQPALEKMLRRSSPQSQGPQLIDEDPSPSTSLLLSASDCTSLEQMPETREIRKRKQYPCRHFLRTGGWCPAGEKCRFHHDVAGLPSAGVRTADHAPPFKADAYGDGRTISGGVLMGVQLPTPPTVSQEHPESPRYTDANQARPYPTYWPNYTWQPYPPYYATVPAPTIVPIPANAAPSAVAQQGGYAPPQPRTQTVPPSENQNGLPMGAYQVNGTTYFPASMPPPVPAPMTYSTPVHPVPYNHAVAPAYPYYAPPTLPANRYDVANPTHAAQSSLDPFASDPMVPRELPVIPQLDKYQISPVLHGMLPLRASPSAQNGGLVSTTATASQEHEFPYQPRKDQRVGHARRISVNIKKHGRANSG